MRAYLIQRASFKSKVFGKGIDSILEFDYMGSSEFEFGAKPKSLQEIRKSIGNHDNYIFKDVEYNKKVITVFLKKEQEAKLDEYLLQIMNNPKPRLKERSDFNTWINPTAFDLERMPKTDFWWDIENHIMFWKKNDDFELMFKSLINIKPH